MEHLFSVREVHDGGCRGAVLDGLGVVGARTWESVGLGGIYAVAEGVATVSSCFAAAVETGAGLSEISGFCWRGSYDLAWSSGKYIFMLG